MPENPNGAPTVAANPAPADAKPANTPQPQALRPQTGGTGGNGNGNGNPKQGGGNGNGNQPKPASPATPNSAPAPTNAKPAASPAPTQTAPRNPFKATGDAAAADFRKAVAAFSATTRTSFQQNYPKLKGAVGTGLKKTGEGADLVWKRVIKPTPGVVNSVVIQPVRRGAGYLGTKGYQNGIVPVATHIRSNKKATVIYVALLVLTFVIGVNFPHNWLAQAVGVVPQTIPASAPLNLGSVATPNVAAPAIVVAATPVVVQPVGVKKFIVVYAQQGDTLEGIAAAFGTNVESIKAFSGKQAMDVFSSNKAGAIAVEATEVNGCIQYAFQFGDTFEHIAQLHSLYITGITAKKIEQDNQNLVGQTLSVCK